MAYTEMYVTSVGVEAWATNSIGNPSSLAEALGNAVAGDRVNILSDSGYALGADAVTGAGDASQMLCFRGYNSSIGDLENTGWNADGSLDTTGFPIITLSGALTMGTNFVLLQNLVLTGGLNSLMIGGAGDYCAVVECSVLNTANNASASCISLDNNNKIINCDLECSGAAHAVVLDTDNTTMIIGNRIKGTEADQILCQSISIGIVIGNLFYGNGIGFNCQSAVGDYVLYGNTFHGLQRAVSMVNSVSTRIAAVLVNNHVTDCAEYINNLYSGTANKVIIEVNNRTRDNTTPRTGIGDGANVGEVTTDTGGASTDYTNAGSDDFTLIDGAPGVETGMRQHTDIGAYQRAAGAGGGGGGKQAGSGGGQVG